MAHSSPYPFRAEMFLCKSCNIKFTMKSHLDAHCANYHNDDVNWKRHLLSAYSKSYHYCSHCEVYFADESKLELHLLTHTGSNKYACEECNAMFVTKEGLSSHADLHKGERFPCPECTLDFALQSSLTRHQRRQHGHPEPKDDDDCYLSSLGRVAALAKHSSESTESADSRECNSTPLVRNGESSQLFAHIST